MDNHIEQQFPAHLHDHNYYVHIQVNGDHNYALNPPIIQENENHNDVQPIDQEENNEHVQQPPMGQEEAVEEVFVGHPETYTRLPGIHRNSSIYVDNVGFKYYKLRNRINAISLVCERQKNNRLPWCSGTASISHNMMDNRLSLHNPHNHQPREIDLNVPFLRHEISERGLDITNTTAAVRTIYNNEIIRNPAASRNYTHRQASRRVFQMRSLRRPKIPQDIHELAMTLNNPRYPNYSQTVQNPSSRFFQQELVVNGRSVGLIFANRDAIARYLEELYTVTMVGIDETFKTVPSHPADLKCLLTFQVVYKNVAFPMIYVLLGSMTEETYCALFTIIRQILPLNYDAIRFVTDYEKALMNAVERIFPTSRLVCCWFHYTQSIVRYCHRKMNDVLNLVKTHQVAANILRMVLALPHLPASINNPLCPEFCVLDGYHAIVQYARQFPEIQMVIQGFLQNYIFGFWIEQISPERFSVFGEDHRTNNYLESFHSTLLRQMGPHPNIWDFFQRLVIIENQFFVEFDQRRRDLTIRDPRSRAERENTSRIIREYVMQLNIDHDILLFLSRTGHLNDGYVQQLIGPYP